MPRLRPRLTRPRARYTRLLRDEVLAEWCDGALHVHCHVRGPGDWWLAPPQLRRWIFRRELGVVLDALRFGDRAYLAGQPQLGAAPVLVYFHGAEGDCARTTVEPWGAFDQPGHRADQPAPRVALPALAQPGAGAVAAAARRPAGPAAALLPALRPPPSRLGCSAAAALGTAGVRRGQL